MVSLCFYFQVHQPFRLNHYRVKQIGSHTPYFDDTKNRQIFNKVATKCYWPAGRLFASLLRRFPQEFSISFSFSGTFLEQCELYDPALLELYQDILALPNAEVICETSHHSLAALADSEEFFDQVEKQRENLFRLFGAKPTVFRNTELIYSDAIGELVHKLGFDGCLLEGWETYLPEGWNAHHLFHHPRHPDLKLLPKSYQLSDDIAFRFSNREWNSWPLTASKYHSWLERLLDGKHEFVGLFMDYETFGEHQWADTGIFTFLETWVESMAKDPRFHFVMPSQAIQRFSPRSPMTVGKPMSWADTERDISAWLGNSIQEDSFAKSYALKKDVLATKSDALLEEWRKLLTSDHLYYMCIKWSQDGDVHKYFSPFESPYDAYLDYANIIEDLTLKCVKFRDAITTAENASEQGILTCDQSSILQSSEPQNPLQPSAPTAT
jgi:alpha-amylase